MTFYIYKSNQSEKLVESLKQVIEQPLANPFEQEYIITQNKPMADWLTMELSKSLGVWSGQSFPFPKKAITQFMGYVLGDKVSEHKSFEPEKLVFEILLELEALKEKPEFKKIKSYIEGDELKRWRFALQLAKLFDQYLVFRKDWIMQWDQGDYSKLPTLHKWQGILWNQISTKKNHGHIANLFQEFKSQLPKHLEEIKQIKRISIFGLSSLPLLYLEIFALLGDHIEINLFHLSPSPHYWADIKSQKEIFKQLRRAKKDLTDEDLHLTEGNPILASLGKVGKDYQANIESTIDYQEHEPSLFVEHKNQSLLGQLQGDIFNLEAIPSETQPLPKGEDLNLKIHGCTNIFREVEVLKDQILQAIKTQAAPLEDFLVMAPDMSLYEPIFKEVFAKTPKIPFTLADSSPLKENRIFDLFFELASFEQKRFTLSGFLNLLQKNEVRSTFDIEEGELKKIRSWLEVAGARWAIDRSDRLHWNQTEAGENSFFEAFSRLILGFCFAQNQPQTYFEQAPIGCYEGLDSLILGKVIALFEAVKSIYLGLREEKTLGEWKEFATQSILNLTLEDESLSGEFHEFYQVLEDLEQDSLAANYKATLSIHCFVILAREKLTQENPGKSYRSAGVTCASLRPMRSIPFAMIFLIGLNERDFPRQDNPVGFNLMQQWPQLGDRSSFEDDRYMLLESILSCRKQYSLSYIYKSTKDGRIKAPSSLVIELLDYLSQKYGLEELPEKPEPKEYLEGLVFFHPERAFDPLYFKNDQPLSFAGHEIAALKALEQYPKTTDHFLADPIEGLIGKDSWELKDLISTLSHPAKALLQRTLGVYFDQEDTSPEDREPQELDGLEKWNLGDEMLRKGQGDLDLLTANLMRRGSLPPAKWGQIACDQIASQAGPILEEVQRLFPLESKRPNETFDFADLKLTGNLENLYEGGLLLASYSEFKAKSLLETWVKHLVLCQVKLKGSKELSYYIYRGSKGKVGIYQFSLVKNPKEELNKLLLLAQKLLRFPLPFIPEVSFAYAQSHLKSEDSTTPKKVAFTALKSEKIQTDAYYQRFFEGLDLFANDQFSALSLELFTPILEHGKRL